MFQFGRQMPQRFSENATKSWPSKHPMGPSGHLLEEEDGQATIEYVLILFVAVSLFLTFARLSSRLQIEQKIMRPITEDFAHAYRLGDPHARAADEPRGPEKIARKAGEERLFLNPDPNQ